MTKEDIKDHIRMEMNSYNEYSGEVEGSFCERGDMTWSCRGLTETKDFCEECGTNIDTDEQHIVHHVPEPMGSELHEVYYCSVSCFREHMNDLFSI